jgi:hypothetical protein
LCWDGKMDWNQKEFALRWKMLIGVPSEEWHKCVGFPVYSTSIKIKSPRNAQLWISIPLFWMSQREGLAIIKAFLLSQKKSR